MLQPVKDVLLPYTAVSPPRRRLPVVATPATIAATPRETAATWRTCVLLAGTCAQPPMRLLPRVPAEAVPELPLLAPACSSPRAKAPTAVMSAPPESTSVGCVTAAAAPGTVPRTATRPMTSSDAEAWECLWPTFPAEFWTVLRETCALLSVRPGAVGMTLSTRP